MDDSVRPPGRAQSCVGLTPRVWKQKGHSLSVDQPDAKTRPAEWELPVPASELKVHPWPSYPVSSCLLR